MSCSDGDTESVATDFTEASIIHPGHEYDADRILAEGQYLTLDESTGTEYLVKWSGYDYDRCTWEPGENCDEILLSAWLQIKQSGTEDFDLDAWNERQLRLTDKRIKRRQERNRKRIHKGLDPWPTDITGAFYEAQEPPVEDTAENNYSTPSRDATVFPPLAATKRPRLFLDSDEESDDSMPLRRQKRRRPSTSTPLPASTGHETLSKAVEATPTRTTASSSTTAPRTNLLPTKNHSNPLASLKPAMRRGPSAQELDSISRRSSFPGARRALAPNVFASDPATSPTSRRSTDGRSRRGGRPGLHTHLAFRNAANKVREKAPTHMPRLTELDTGNTVPAAPNQTSGQKTHAPLQNLAVPPLELSNDDNDSSNATPSKFLKCWFRAHKGHCPHGSSCAFEHSDGYTVAAFENKLMKHQATCFYWATQGKCHHNEDRCAWSHNLTGYVAHPNRAPVKLTAEMAEKIVEKTDKCVTMPLSNKHKPPKRLGDILGCWFYHMSPKGCTRTSERCKFSHGRVDWVASLGGKDTYLSPIWVGQISGISKPSKLTNDDLQMVQEQREDSASPAREIERDSNSSPPQARVEQPPVMASSQAPTHHLNSRSQHALPRRISRGDTSALPARIRFNLFKPEIDLAVVLQGLTQTSHVTEILKTCRNMVFTQMLLKPLLQTRQSYAFLPGTPNDITSEHAETTEAVRCKLVEANAAAILETESCIVLVFPNRQDWQFLDANAGRSEASLRFGLLQALEIPPSISTSPTKVVAVDRSSLLRNMFSALDMVQLFALPGTGTREERRNIFLAFPNSQYDIGQALAAVLFEKGADVFDSGSPGSWAQFRQLTATSSKAFIVFHSSVEAFGTIPGLNELLKFSSVDAFRLFPGKRIYYPGGGIGISPAKMVRLFPRGRVVLLMDDCFDEEPEQSLEAVEYFAKRASNLDYGKMIGGPDLLDRLLHPPAATSVDDQKLLVKSWQYLNEIRDQGAQEHSGFNANSELCNFFCATEDNLPDYSAKWQSRDSKEQSEARHFLAFWFSMWASSHADQWRRFVLVTAAGHKTRTELQKLYQHIMVVTPYQYVRLEESIEKNKATQGRTSDHKRLGLNTAGLGAFTDLRNTPGSSTKSAPKAVMGGGSGPSTPVDARLTPRSTPRSPETMKDGQQDAAVNTGFLDPRLKMRRENQQKAARK